MTVRNLTLCAIFLAALTPANAEFTSRIQVGNWNGGAWANPQTKVFSNCGLSVKFQSGTEFTVLMTNDYRPFLIVIDPRIQTQPQARMAVPAKFDASDIELQGTALTATMIQMPLPGIPNNYDIIRGTKRISFTLPGFTTTIDVAGLDKALPRIFECTVAERAKMQLPAAPAQEQPLDRAEAVAAGLAVAEKVGLGSHIVFRDEARPGGNEFKSSPVVWGHAGVPGPGGPANILGIAFIRMATPDVATAAAKAHFLSDLNRIGRKQTGDLPAIPGRPESFGVWAVGEAAYEEWYLVRRKNGGYFQFTTTTPLAGRRTAEAAGEKFRAAIAAVAP
ncbi:MAG: hypothetical protein ACRCTI_16870 [Beijerinckiaceae bacterium]